MAEPKSIQQLLQAFFAGQLGTAAPREGQARELWERLMGPEIAAATERLSFRRGTLTVTLRDPLLRNELRYHTERLTELLRAAGLTNLNTLRIA